MGDEEMRFGYLRKKTNEELDAIIKETQDDIDTCYGMLDDYKVSYVDKQELRSDLKYDRDILEFIAKIKEERIGRTK